MISGEQFSEIALDFPGTEKTGHFERVGFRIKGKRMFATYLAKNNTANIFLHPGEQAVFGAMYPEHIYPVPNKWGIKGATTFELNRLTKNVVLEALLSAYNRTIHP